jgi:RloB-like protein
MSKSRNRSAKVLKRKGSLRASHDRILIVCEGAKTEPNYLKEICKLLRIGSVGVFILHSRRGQEPQQVVESADEEFAKTKAYEKVYAVFDRDDHCTYANAIDMAKARNLSKKTMRAIKLYLKP